MDGSVERVRTLFSGGVPDRPPLFDLLRNDAVLSHFSGTPLTLDNAEQVVFNACEPAIDATRPSVRLPHREETIILEDGREQRHYRWTAARDIYEQAHMIVGLYHGIGKNHGDKRSGKEKSARQREYR